MELGGLFVVSVKFRPYTPRDTYLEKTETVVFRDTYSSGKGFTYNIHKHINTYTLLRLPSSGLSVTMLTIT